MITPDVVDMAIALLQAEMPTPAGELPATVTGEVPEPRPARFCVVTLAGGPGRPSQNPVVDRVALSVEAWADVPAKANDLAQLARGLLLSAQGVVLSGAQVYRAEDAGSPAPLPDPLASGQHRVVFTVVWTVRLRRRPT